MSQTEAVRRWRSGLWQESQTNTMNRSSPSANCPSIAPACRTVQQQIWQPWILILYEETLRSSAWESDDENQR